MNSFQRVSELVVMTGKKLASVNPQSALIDTTNDTKC